MYGVKVTAEFADGSFVTLRNVTKIHYRYQRMDRVAFESYIHGTSYTYFVQQGDYIADVLVIKEFWTEPETEIEEEM